MGSRPSLITNPLPRESGSYPAQPQKTSHLHLHKSAEIAVLVSIVLSRHFGQLVLRYGLFAKGGL